jgi:hypothetical protein
MAAKGISSYIEYGQKKGQHWNDERANTSGYDLVWRFDDDCVAEPDVLSKLVAQMKDDVGAVGCSVLTPPLWQSEHKSSSIDDLYAQNKQWFPITQTEEVDHLHCSYLYRANISHWDLRLSNKAFRGETMFSYSLKLKGYKVLITPGTIWHFKSAGGGNRDDAKAIADQQHDHAIFERWLAFTRRNKKLYIIREGLGDHYVFRQVITPEPGSIIACCYPEVFKDRTDCEIVSIAQAEEWVDASYYEVYKWANETGRRKHMAELYKDLYEHLSHTR